VAEAGPALLYVLHDVNGLDLKPAAAQINVVISGHSHKPGLSRRDGVLYVNPGSAGPRRFQLPVSVAQLDLSASPYKVQFIDLTSGKELSV
jgi:predicted phosphodiesterase